MLDANNNETTDASKAVKTALRVHINDNQGTYNGSVYYQNVTTAAYSFALIVFALFGVLFLTQRQLLKRLS